MKFRRMRVGALTFLVVPLIAALSLLGFSSVGATGVSRTAIPYLATGYRYAVVAHGGVGDAFAVPAFDDSSWSIGDAGFGSINSYCTITSPAFVNTDWPLNTDILVRKHFTLPTGANNVVVSVAVDNHVQIFVNGADVSGGTRTHEGCAADGNFTFTVPDSVLNAGDNVIAVRGIDTGFADYLDIQVTYDAPTYETCPLYRTTKIHKSGSTVPIKIQLCDESGNNVSSSDIVVHATAVQTADGSVDGPLNDSGSANGADMNFRYDPQLDGYVFNLSTKGLTAGDWQLVFSVNGELQSTYRAPFVVR